MRSGEGPGAEFVFGIVGPKCGLDSDAIFAGWAGIDRSRERNPQPAASTIKIERGTTSNLFVTVGFCDGDGVDTREARLRFFVILCDIDAFYTSSLSAPLTISSVGVAIMIKGSKGRIAGIARPKRTSLLTSRIFICWTTAKLLRRSASD